MNMNAIEMSESVSEPNANCVPRGNALISFYLFFILPGHLLRHQISHWLSVGVSFSWGRKKGLGNIDK